MSKVIRLVNSLGSGLRTDRSIQAWKWCMQLVQSCSSMDQLKTIHAIFITHGIHLNSYAVGKLLSFCTEKGDLSYASLLFAQLPNPNSFAYNTLIRAYSRSSQPYLALKYFNLMSCSSQIRPDGFTFPFVLIACSDQFLRFEGEQLHSCIIKNGILETNAHVQTALVRFYSEHKVLDDARKVFDDITELDVIQCNVLMNGYVKCNMGSDALGVLRVMLVRGIEPDEFCLNTGLTACTQMGDLEQGKWIHDYVRKKKMVSDVFVWTSLVDMYAKCGCIEMAVEVFKSIPKRTKFSWAAMVGGYAVHGHAKEAIQCLDKMQREDGIEPDGVIVLGVLAACKHAGLSKEGQFLLENMETLYGIVPGHEHYSCIVDLLCRVGQLGEAIVLIKRMPMKPMASVWGALLSACRSHNNVNLAEIAVKELLEVEDINEEDVAYVQLSNIYLATRKCDDARRIRKMIGEKGLKKVTGFSSIKIDGLFHEFVSGDVSHSRLSEIHLVLHLMSLDGCFD